MVGIVRISVAGLADPSDPEGKWAAVRVKPLRKLAHPVTLKAIKANPALAATELVKLSRLSVAVVLSDEWREILIMAEH